MRSWKKIQINKRRRNIAKRSAEQLRTKCLTCFLTGQMDKVPLYTVGTTSRLLASSLSGRGRPLSLMGKRSSGQHATRTADFSTTFTTRFNVYGWSIQMMASDEKKVSKSVKRERKQQENKNSWSQPVILRLYWHPVGLAMFSRPFPVHDRYSDETGKKMRIDIEKESLTERKQK